MKRSVKRLREEGQGLVEYALVIVLVAVVAIVIVAALGNRLQYVFCDAVIKLGGTAPDSIKACVDPRVSVIGWNTTLHYPSHINAEILVQNNKGSTGQNISNVVITDDTGYNHTEYTYHYCIGGGDDNCDVTSTQYYTVQSGHHVIHIVATDTHGNTGETTIEYTGTP